MKSQHPVKASHDSRPSDSLFRFTLWPNSRVFYFIERGTLELFRRAAGQDR
jgi:hypothetical protein